MLVVGSRLSLKRPSDVGAEDEANAAAEAVVDGSAVGEEPAVVAAAVVLGSDATCTLTNVRPYSSVCVNRTEQ